jgi:hypothetical protein
VRLKFFSFDFGLPQKSFGVRLFLVPQNVYANIFNTENFEKNFKQKSLRKIKIDELITF